MVTFRKTAQRW